MGALGKSEEVGGKDPEAREGLVALLVFADFPFLAAFLADLPFLLPSPFLDADCVGGLFLFFEKG